MKLKKSFLLTLILFTGLMQISTYAEDVAVPTAQDNIMRQVSVDPKIGAVLPLDLPFVNSKGESIRLEDLFTSEKPVILVPVYFKCPMLCGLVLKGVLKTLNLMRFTAANEFELIVFSINPNETYSSAADKKKLFLKEYTKTTDADPGVHFLVGEESSIKALTDTIGFNYAYDPISGEYAHAASVQIVTPKAKVGSYFGGIEYSPRDFRFALIQASAGRIGTIVDKLLLTCYHYDPRTGKYGLVISNVLKIFGSLTASLLVGFIIFSLRKEKRHCEAQR